MEEKERESKVVEWKMRCLLISTFRHDDRSYQYFIDILEGRIKHSPLTSLDNVVYFFLLHFFFHRSLPLLPAGFRQRNNFETKIDLEYFNSLKLSRAGSVRFFNIILRSCRIQERLWVESLFFSLEKCLRKVEKKMGKKTPPPPDPNPTFNILSKVS